MQVGETWAGAEVDEAPPGLLPSRRLEWCRCSVVQVRRRAFLARLLHDVYVVLLLGDDT